MAIPTEQNSEPVEEDLEWVLVDETGNREGQGASPSTCSGPGRDIDVEPTDAAREHAQPGMRPALGEDSCPASRAADDVPSGGEAIPLLGSQRTGPQTIDPITELLMLADMLNMMNSSLAAETHGVEVEETEEGEEGDQET